MQSGQMGVPQFEHDTPVSTRGWFTQYLGPAVVAVPGLLDTRSSVPSRFRQP
jgi:hypothetical protein